MQNPAPDQLMNRCDTGFDYQAARAWFVRQEHPNLAIVAISEDGRNGIEQLLPPHVRRCYITDEALRRRAEEVGVPIVDVIRAKIPDPGAVMSGDFGEVLAYFMEGTNFEVGQAIGPKKWRLKQDRNQPAPHSDVLHFIIPEWPRFTDSDAVLCSEVKAKSTRSAFQPIGAAIEGAQKDRTSRLARTLVWLRERAVTDGLDDISVRHLDRYLNVDEHPRYDKRFRAVAVVCSSLLPETLEEMPEDNDPGIEVVLIVVPDLYRTYTAVFDAVLELAELLLDADT